jgi:hypothetical protein
MKGKKRINQPRMHSPHQPTNDAMIGVSACVDVKCIRPKHPPFIPPEVFALDRLAGVQEDKESENDTGDGTDRMTEEKTPIMFDQIRELLDGLFFGMFCPIGDQFWSNVSSECNGGGEERFWESMMQHYMKEWNEDDGRVDETIEGRRGSREIEHAYRLWDYVLSQSSRMMIITVTMIMIPQFLILLH